jgi:hypothetical protein
MSENKINSVEMNYDALDINELTEDLQLAEVENLGEREYAVAKYKADGVRPTKIAKADADKFGLRKAFWDVYSPVDSTQGRWIVESDAESGDEFIVLKAES